MSTKYLTLAAVAVAALSVSACESYPWSPAQKAPGVYKSTATSTSPNGTTTKTKETTSVYRDASGDKKAVVKTETTRDPEGLFNKEKTTTVKTYN